MKALSLTQPWATLVALRAKRIETRSWYTSHRGPLVIHAAQGYPEWAKQYALDPTFRKALGDLNPAMLPRGCGLCIVTIVACVKTEHIRKLPELGIELHVDELKFGNFEDGRWAWALELDHVFPKPVLAKGAQRLWEWPQKELRFPPPSTPRAKATCSLRLSAGRAMNVNFDFDRYNEEGDGVSEAVPVARVYERGRGKRAVLRSALPYNGLEGAPGDR